MRFFKSFPGFPFHRRSKSDSSIPKPTLARDYYIPTRPQSLDAATAALFAAAVPSCPQTVLFPTPTDAANAIFELEFTNSRLQRDVSALAGQCSQLRSLLETTRADLFSQLHQNTLLQRQTQEHKADMDAMQTKLAQYERFLGLMINVGLHQRVLGDAHAAMRAGVDTDEALVDAIKEAAAIPGNAWSTIISSVTGPRTQDEYKSSLNLTIKTRKELRDVRKIAKFWKNVAQDEGRLDIVTPSVSTISSIHETLPPERQKAVEELMVTRRRLSPESQSKAIELAVAGLPNSASSSSSSLTSTSLASTSADITPSNSAIELHCLSPLASESFKSELASRSSSTRLFKRSLSSKPIRPPLGTIDTNIGLNLSDQRAEARGKRKADSTDENALPHVYTAPVRGRDLVVSSVVPSFSKHSICTNRLGPLGRIEEEREDFLCIDAEDVQVGTELQMQKGQVSRGMAVSQESNWCMVEFPEQDLSFSFCDTTMSSPPKIGQANAATPTKSSRLPKPVLRKLNRMTIPKSTAGHGIDLEVLRAPTPLFIKKRSTDGLATTRLPTSTQGRRLWRT